MTNLKDNDLEVTQAFIRKRPSEVKKYQEEVDLSADKFIADITNPVLPDVVTEEILDAVTLQGRPEAKENNLSTDLSTQYDSLINTSCASLNSSYSTCIQGCVRETNIGTTVNQSENKFSPVQDAVEVKTSSLKTGEVNPGCGFEETKSGPSKSIRGKIVVPPRSAQYAIPTKNTPGIYHKQDIGVVHLEDMGEKIALLTENIDNYKSNPENRTPASYRRLEESCVKYSIQLDRVNVIGRNELRESRRKLLIYMDKLSTELVQTVQN